MWIMNGKFVTPDGIKSGAMEVVGGRIVRFAKKTPSGAETLDVRGRYVLPGFIEIHTHGAGGFEFTAGRYDTKTAKFLLSEDIYREDLPRYAALRGSTGVTTLFPGTWAAPEERLRFCWRMLREYMDSSGNGRDGSRIAGGCLEGTFINPEMSGAQNPAYIRPPDREFFDRLNETGVIRLVNVVPDYGEAACRLTKHLAARGISVGAGHTNGTFDQFRASYDAGLKYCIHFLNGPTGHSYKSFDGGGALEAVLRLPLFVEIIMDNIHVAPSYVRDVIARKGAERVMAVADAMFLSQASGIREFVINGIPGVINEEEGYVYVKGKEKRTLFSSILTMDRAFGNILSHLTKELPGVWYERHPALSFDEAVLSAARICSTNIAAMLRDRGGLELESGALRGGWWADFVVGNIGGGPGEYRLDVEDVFVRGVSIMRDRIQGRKAVEGRWGAKLADD